MSTTHNDKLVVMPVTWGVKIVINFRYKPVTGAGDGELFRISNGDDVIKSRGIVYLRNS
jgi:hypothetical protein